MLFFFAETLEFNFRTHAHVLVYFCAVGSTSERDPPLEQVGLQPWSPRRIREPTHAHAHARTGQGGRGDMCCADHPQSNSLAPPWRGWLGPGPTPRPSRRPGGIPLNKTLYFQSKNSLHQKKLSFQSKKTFLFCPDSSFSLAKLVVGRPEFQKGEIRKVGDSETPEVQKKS